MLKKIIEYLADLIFPEKCLICGVTGSIVCEKCEKTFKPLNCRIIETKQPLDKLFCYSPYSGSMKTLITKFKFHKKKQAAPFIASYMSETILPNIAAGEKENTILIPVPLHQKRERTRGFNQSLLLAKNISGRLKISYDNNIVGRIKNTAYMHCLSKTERFKNIKNAFIIKNIKSIENKNIIIVDDITTTGATLLQIASLLKKNGARTVYALTAAITMR